MEPKRIIRVGTLILTVTLEFFVHTLRAHVIFTLAL